jgi:FkbM family methyltransferase
MVRCVAPAAAIYAFEPHPGAFARLERQAATHGYTAFNVGCGDQAGPATLYDYEGQEGTILASLYPEVITGWWRTKAAAVAIEIIRLDDFIRNYHISRVDLIKIDTEGHEVRVLDGMEAAVAADMIDVLQIEFNVMSVYSRTFVRDLYTRLPQYRLYRMLPTGLVPLGSYSPVLCELYGFQNLVAIREGCGITL